MNAHIQAADATPSAILNTSRQLHDYAWLVRVLQQLLRCCCCLVLFIMTTSSGADLSAASSNTVLGQRTMTIFATIIVGVWWMESGRFFNVHILYGQVGRSSPANRKQRGHYFYALQQLLWLVSVQVHGQQERRKERNKNKNCKSLRSVYCYALLCSADASIWTGKSVSQWFKGSKEQRVWAQLSKLFRHNERRRTRGFHGLLGIAEERLVHRIKSKLKSKDISRILIILQLKILVIFKLANFNSTSHRALHTDLVNKWVKCRLAGEDLWSFV